MTYFLSMSNILRQSVSRMLVEVAKNNETRAISTPEIRDMTVRTERNVNEKPRVCIFIDSSNLYHAAKKAGWTIDLFSLRQLFELASNLIGIHYHVALPNQQDSTYVSAKQYLSTISTWVTLHTKPLKYLVDDNGRVTKKGDVDVELSLDVVEKLHDIDVAVVMSGDSDYQVLGQYAAKRGVPVIFMCYKANMAWELRLGNHLFVEHIRELVERGNKNPDLSVGAVLVSTIIAKAIAGSSVSQEGVDNQKDV